MAAFEMDVQFTGRAGIARSAGVGDPMLLLEESAADSAVQRCASYLTSDGSPRPQNPADNKILPIIGKSG